MALVIFIILETGLSGVKLMLTYSRSVYYLSCFELI